MPYTLHLLEYEIQAGKGLFQGYLPATSTVWPRSHGVTPSRHVLWLHALHLRRHASIKHPPGCSLQNRLGGLSASIIELGQGTLCACSMLCTSDRYSRFLKAWQPGLGDCNVVPTPLCSPKLLRKNIRKPEIVLMSGRLLCPI